MSQIRRWQYPQQAAIDPSVLGLPDQDPPQLDKWFQPFSEPMQHRARPYSFAALIIASGAIFTGEPITLDKWLALWPNRIGPALEGPAAQPYFALDPTPVTPSEEIAIEWTQPWPEPRAAPRLGADLQQSFAIDPVALSIPEDIQTDRWLFAWSEPVREPLRLPVAMQTAFTVDDPAPPPEPPPPPPVVDAPTATMAFLFDGGHWQYPSFAALVIEPTDLPIPETITVDKWWRPASEPVRVRARLATASQAALFVDLETLALQEHPSIDKWGQPLNQPPRGHVMPLWSFPALMFVGEPGDFPPPPPPSEGVVEEGFMVNVARWLRNR